MVKAWGGRFRFEQGEEVRVRAGYPFAAFIGIVQSAYGADQFGVVMGRDNKIVFWGDALELLPIALERRAKALHEAVDQEMVRVEPSGHLPELTLPPLPDVDAIREHIAIARAIPLGPGDAPQLADALANDAERLLAEVDANLVVRAAYKILVQALVAIRDSGMSRFSDYAAFAESKAREALAAADVLA